MENSNWIVDIFTFIGVAVSIIVTLIAIVWLTCFVVKLLVKTFGARVGKSFDLMIEDINKKSEAKKERNELKRNAKIAQKMEILNMKLESKERIHEMKKNKLEERLEQKETVARDKIFGKFKTEEKLQKLAEKDNFEKDNAEKPIKENEQVEEKIISDGEELSTDVIKQENEKKQPKKKANNKK